MKKTVLFSAVAIIFAAGACNKTRTGLCHCTSPSTDPAVVEGLHIADSLYGNIQVSAATCALEDANEKAIDSSITCTLH